MTSAPTSRRPGAADRIAALAEDFPGGRPPVRPRAWDLGVRPAPRGRSGMPATTPQWYEGL